MNTNNVVTYPLEAIIEMDCARCQHYIRLKINDGCYELQCAKESPHFDHAPDECEYYQKAIVDD